MNRTHSLLPRQVADSVRSQLDSMHRSEQMQSQLPLSPSLASAHGGIVANDIGSHLGDRNGLFNLLTMCMYMCMHMWMYMCMRMCMHMHMYMPMCMCMCTHMSNVHMCVYMYMHMRICTRMCMCMYMYMCRCMRMCICICICLGVTLYTHVTDVCLYTRIEIHTHASSASACDLALRVIASIHQARGLACGVPCSFTQDFICSCTPESTKKKPCAL